MKTTFKFIIAFAVLTLCNVTVSAQNADFYKQQIEVCLSTGNAEKAQIMYDAWKDLTKRTDAAIEKRIEESKNQGIGYIEFPDKGFDVQTKDIGINVSYDTAKLMCNNSTVGGFNDWRLPELDELMFLFLEKDRVKNFTNNSYWTGIKSSDHIRSIVHYLRRINGVEKRPYVQGYVYSDTQIVPTLNNAEITTNGAFTSFDPNVKTNTTYYLRGYARYSDGYIQYGDIEKIKTPVIQIIDFGDGNIISLDDETKNAGRFNVRCVRMRSENQSSEPVIYYKESQTIQH